MVNKTLPVGIIILLIISAIGPMISGTNTISHGEDFSQDLDDLLFYVGYDNPYTTESIIQDKYLYHMKYFDGSHNPKDEVNLEEAFLASSQYEVEKQLPQTISHGPMDSAWPMFCHDIQRTGRSPYGQTGDAPVVKWKFWMDGMTVSSPAIDENETVYIGAEDFHDSFFAINPDGTEKWRFGTGDYIMSSPAIGADGTIYVGSNNGNLYALKPDGTKKWSFDVGDGWVYSSPVINDVGVIYVASVNGKNICAVYPNGTKKWDFHANDYIYCSPAIDEDGNIYIGSNDGYMYALYSNNGTIKWKYYAGGPKGIGSAPTLDDDGGVYFGSTDGYLYALHSNGTLKWKYNTGYWIGGSSPAINEEGTLYVGTNNRKIYSINPDGTENWNFEVHNDISASPVIDKYGTIYVGDWNGYLYAMNPDGSLRWKFSAGDGIESSVAIAEDGTIYVAAWFHPSRGRGSYTYLYALEVVDNNPPSDPTITGETNGKFGESYDYNFNSTDPEDQDVWYYIVWGDETNSGWIGPYESGKDVVVSHIWDKRGTYEIKAKAKDEFDAEGEWGTLEVTMPVNQQSYGYGFPFIQKILERFPNAFPIIRHLIGL